MTLAELKSEIVSIEKQLTSIDIPIKRGWMDVRINIGIATDQDGKIFATFDSYETGGDGAALEKTSILSQIRTLEIGEQIEFHYTGDRPVSIQSATSKIGRFLGRRFTTRTNRSKSTVKVLRVE